MIKMNYDIFISCKSEDYPVARKVYQYLKGQNYSVFLADTELRKKGNAEYGKIIDEALDTATHMIIIASNPEYIRSTYVESEWRIFMEEKRAGRKTGNIITIINFPISALPISLRVFQSFVANDFVKITDFLPISKPNQYNLFVKLKDSIELRYVNGEYVIIDKTKIDFDTITLLNETAVYLFRKIQGRYFNSIMLANFLQEKYDVNNYQAELDAQQLIKEWIKLGFVELKKYNE